MKENKKLKSRIKLFMRDKNTAITAYDLPTKFCRGMSLVDAIEFMVILELKDSMIGKSRIEDVNGDGVNYSYHYLYKRKNRGERG